jgi:hypothetical protein
VVEPDERLVRGAEPTELTPGATDMRFPAGRSTPEPRFVAGGRPRFDTPGVPTVAARPGATERVRGGTHRRPLRWRRALLMAGLATAVGVGIGVWYAVHQGLVLEWPSWVPWS